MPVIAVINQKGGSGKSTLATHMAAWCASQGLQVMLGDVDRQQSVRSWLSRRNPAAAPITTWAVDHGKVFRAPPGTTHVVLDTPGALHGYELAKLVVWLDAVLVPIGPSLFDRDAAVKFMAELNQLPRVSSGRCKVIAVGMRWPQRQIDAWRASGKQWDIPLLTVLRDDPRYQRCLESGASLFDLLEKSSVDIRSSDDTAQWAPLLEWLRQIWATQPRGHGPKVSAAPNFVEGPSLTTTAEERARIVAGALAARVSDERFAPSRLAKFLEKPSEGLVSVPPFRMVQEASLGRVPMDPPTLRDVSLVPASPLHSSASLALVAGTRDREKTSRHQDQAESQPWLSTDESKNTAVLEASSTVTQTSGPKAFTRWFGWGGANAKTGS